MSVEIYSTDTDSGQITVIRKDGPSAHQVTKEIAVGNAPRGGVKFTRDGRGFVSNTSTNTVSELDALTRREVARITVGSGPRGLGIVPGERYLLVSNSGSNTVSVVDLESRTELTQVAVARDPRHMAISKDGRFAYVCIWGSGYIAKLDLSGLVDEGRPDSIREVARIHIGEDSFPYSLNIDRTGKRAYVACNAIEAVPVIDLETDKVIAKVAVKSDGGRAVAFTPDNAFALLTLERISQIAVIDTDELVTTRYIPVGPGPRGIAVDDADNTVYCSVFARTVPSEDEKVEFKFNPHTLTVVHLDGVDLSLPADEGGNVQYDEVRVGYGPCSVAVFNTAEVAYDESKLNEAAARLNDGAKAAL
ncbi:YncE family protein [Streptomyces canus]|uniref:YncE family protein n=1 Tax=Streptomyces canus TaxID=58343 RepID=UPI002DD7B015|nr:YncE family protein [Streptomyces canus]WSD83117.1 YncE family protein [Streptomyces canus]